MNARRIPRLRVQEFVIRTSAYPPLRWAYGAAYGAVLAGSLVRLKLAVEVQLVELKLPTDRFCFGSSDLDVWAQVAPRSLPAFFALCERLASMLDSSGTWSRIVDLYVLSGSEAELKRQLESQSLSSRWVRIIGPKAVVPRAPGQPVRSRLGRAMYRFAGICQEVLCSPLEAHHLRILSKHMLEIDDESRALEKPRARADGAPQALSLARWFAHGKRLPADGFRAAACILSMAQDRLTALSAAESQCAVDAADVPVRIVGRCIAPDTLESAVAAVKQSVERACSDLCGAVSSVILGGDPGCNYSYRIYFVLRDGIVAQQRIAIYAKLRSWVAAADIGDALRYLRQRYPIIVTVPMWQWLHRGYHLERPVEEFYFLKRHGVVLWGEDIRDQLAVPSRVDCLRSAGIAVADLRTNLWRAMHRGRPARLADHLLGRIPTLWLLLSYGVMATSAGEAVEGALTEGLPGAEVLAQLYRRLRGLPPQDLPPTSDPVWGAALERAGDWTDRMLHLALAALK